ncbi:hypothetical protein NDN01_12355 [Sphingomonas sp. QA11]|uniref:hypothetical protein n=1 Tax=Sphingomonas sp. QA11 TaxID=2950605 RepID=UPI00234A6B66|nr:hypothetical protein [Sphingomonas sp. QA11]WCM29617.1 hypothetical protein NDN01_12355 [Sphingomonas sp. QA11]
MKAVLIASAVCAAWCAAPVAAQQALTDAAQSNSAVTVEAITGPVSEAPASEHVTYSGHEWTTPSAQGSYFGGANPCLIGTGGGAAGGPVAFSLNLGRNDEGCNRRSDAAAWHAMGFDNVAVSRMCQDIKSADAFFAATGSICPGADRSRYHMADGSTAPVASLVSNSRAIAANPYSGPVDFSNPAVQAAIHQEAMRMLAAGAVPGYPATTVPTDPRSGTPLRR